MIEITNTNNKTVLINPFQITTISRIENPSYGASTKIELGPASYVHTDESIESLKSRIQL